VQIEKSVNDMLNAAKADGIDDLKASSAFRSYAHQVDLRRRHCGGSEYDIYQKPSGECSPETAKPGTSNHEDGLAIDFSGIDKCPANINGSCAHPGNAHWEWLNRRAGEFGFEQFVKEAWHWSPSGG
jgi:LAS superfamily LD-carboxypeptidase LdcB